MVEILRSSSPGNSLFRTLGIGNSISADLTYMQRIENALTLPIIDYYEPTQVESINSLYKAISPVKAEQLLNAGVDKKTAVSTAVDYYLNSILDPLQDLNQTRTVSDPVGIYALTGDNTVNYNYDDKKYAEIETGEGDDTINISGSNNPNIVVDAGDGTNIINIDDTKEGTNITVAAGSGYDSVYLQGNIADYTQTNNPDGTVTLTNNINGNAISIDILTIDKVYALDGEIPVAPPMVINGTPGDDNLDVTTYNGKNITVNGLGANDTVNLGGMANNVTVNLLAGNDTINVDDTSTNTFNINAGAGTDIVNMAGNLNSYTFQDNGDGTLTITKVTNGAQTTIDANVEQVNFADSSTLTYDGTTFTIGDAAGQATTFDMTAYNNSNFAINAEDADDTINLGGTGNTVNVNTGSGNDTINIDDTTNSTYTVNGGLGTDILNLSGNVADYTMVNNGDNTVTLTNTISNATITLDITNIEEVNAADGQINLGVIINGTPGDDNLGDTGYADTTILINGLGGNDTVSLAGSNNSVTVNLEAGNDTINVNDINASTFNINAGDGTDTVNMTGNLSDYTFLDNGDGTLTMTRTSSGATTTIDANVELVTFIDNKTLTYDGRILTFTDGPGASTTFNMTSFNNTSLVVNAGGGDDTLTVGGTGNTISFDAGAGTNTVNIQAGTNNIINADLTDGTSDIVNIDDTLANNTINITGSASTVINLQGNISDYYFHNNGDGTITMTNTVSNTAITVNNAQSTINFANSIVGNFNAGTFTITGTNAVDELRINGDNTTFLMTTANGSDIITIGGSSNTVMLDAGAQNDSIYIESGRNNTITVNGGTQTDTIYLEGDAVNWTLGGSSITHNLSGTTVTLNSVENVSFYGGMS